MNRGERSGKKSKRMKIKKEEKVVEEKDILYYRVYRPVVAVVVVAVVIVAVGVIFWLLSLDTSS